MKSVTSMTITEGITLVNLENMPVDLNFFSEVLGVFAYNEVNIDMISQTAAFSDKFSVSFTVPGAELEKTLSIIAALRSQDEDIKISARSGNSKIAVFGEEMNNLHGVAYKAVKALSDEKIPIVLITTSENEISFLISSTYIFTAQSAFKDVFYL